MAWDQNGRFIPQEFNNTGERAQRNQLPNPVQPQQEQQEISLDGYGGVSEPEEGLLGNFGLGLRSGIHSTAGLLKGAGAIAADIAYDATGARWTKSARDSLLKGYMGSMEAAAENAPDITDIRDIDSMSDAGKFVFSTIGQLAPTVAEAFAAAMTGAGLAGVAGKKLLKEVIEKKVQHELFEGIGKKAGQEVLEKELAKGVAKEIAEKKAGQAAYRAANAKAIQDIKRIGAKTGVVMGVGAMEGGGMYGEDVERRGADNANPYSALGLGVVSGASEIVSPSAKFMEGMMFGRNLQRANKALTLKRVPGKIAGDMAQEAGQEMIQQGIGDVNEAITTPGDHKVLDPWDYANAGVAGAIGGFIPGAGSAYAQYRGENKQAKVYGGANDAPDKALSPENQMQAEDLSEPVIEDDFVFDVSTGQYIPVSMVEEELIQQRRKASQPPTMQELNQQQMRGMQYGLQFEPDMVQSGQVSEFQPPEKGMPGINTGYFGDYTADLDRIIKTREQEREVEEKIKQIERAEDTLKNLPHHGSIASQPVKQPDFSGMGMISALGQSHIVNKPIEPVQRESQIPVNINPMDAQIPIEAYSDNKNNIVPPDIDIPVDAYADQINMEQSGGFEDDSYSLSSEPWVQAQMGPIKNQTEQPQTVENSSNQVKPADADTDKPEINIPEGVKVAKSGRPFKKSGLNAVIKKEEKKGNKVEPVLLGQDAGGKELFGYRVLNNEENLKTDDFGLVGKKVQSGSTTGIVKRVSPSGKTAILDDGSEITIGAAPNWQVFESNKNPEKIIDQDEQSDQELDDIKYPVSKSRAPGLLAAQLGNIEKLTAKVKEDTAYQNAVKNSDKQNAKIESEYAVHRAMLEMIDTEPDFYKRYADEKGFADSLKNIVFDKTYPQENRNVESGYDKNSAIKKEIPKDVIVAKSGRPFQKSGINMVLRNMEKKGQEIEIVDFGGGEYGYRLKKEAKEKFIGINKDKNRIGEDNRGVRFYEEKGVRVSQPVSVIPGLNGVGLESENLRGLFDKGRYDFLTTEEIKDFEEIVAREKPETIKHDHKLGTSFPPAKPEDVQEKISANDRLIQLAKYLRQEASVETRKNKNGETELVLNGKVHGKVKGRVTAEDAAKILAKNLSEQMRKEGIDFNQNPENMTLDEFTIAYNSKHIPEFDVLGHEIGTVIKTREDGTFKVDIRELYNKVQTQKNYSMFDGAEELAQMIASKEKITSNILFQIADKAFKGTQAQGKYSVKDAYDLLELGVNLYLDNINSWNPAEADISRAKRHIDFLEALTEKLPTQTKRTKEQQEFQQFSTPPAFAYAVNWIADVKNTDTVLEPSAGIGGIAVFAKKAGADVYVNELSKRRAKFLEELEFTEVFTENAEQIDNILPDRVKPTVVVMNPPFSSTAGRTNTNSNMNGAKHIEQALARLEDGGRLVAIVGGGMSMEAQSTKKFFDNISKKYNIRANVKVSGKGYTKYGTNFDNRVLVIDKVQEKSDVITAEVENYTELIELLEDVKRSRYETNTKRPDSKRTGENKSKQGSTEGIVSDGGNSGRLHSSVSSAFDSEGGEGGNIHGSSGNEYSVQDDGRRPELDNGQGFSGEGGNRGPAGTGRGAERPVQGVSTGNSAGNQGGMESSLEADDNRTERKDRSNSLTDSVYDEYIPNFRIKGAKKHITPLVESAAMAGTKPPVNDYIPNIPEETVKQGKLTEPQLEAIAYAGRSHQNILRDGSRQGFFIGDGTGVGKGREISGIILDNWRNGRKKAIWISEKASLFNDAKRDLNGIGFDEGEQSAFQLKETKLGQKIKNNTGILFTQYATLKGGLDKIRLDDPSTWSDMQARLNQIVDWAGKDYDGVIAFDESHNMANSIDRPGKRGKKDAAKQALAGVLLQDMLPNARVVYVSATGATEVANLAYAKRLGLWGKGTPFSNVQDFISKIAGSGISAMELVARDIKSLGLYIARSLSYADVKYTRLEHKLTPEQTEIYNTLARAWQNVLANIEEAIKVSGGSNKNRGQALGQFWGAHQRFFNQIITAMQTPALIQSVKKDIENGHSAVIQLTNTFAANEEKALARREEGDSLEDLDLTPRENLMTFLENSFPVIQYEEYTDENGTKQTREVRDSEGRVVLNKEAVKMRDRLIAQVGSLSVPDTPINMIIDAFGRDMVSEITGRKKRVVTDETGKKIIEPWSDAKANKDVADFLDDKKRILIFSEKGGTGSSYHAALDVKNQRLRRHYLLQPGWRADKAVQGLGRSHRAFEKQAPEFVLVTTDLPAQKRFLSSIARRLNQLGALTKGQRQTGSQGIFGESDNLESLPAVMALERFIKNINTYEGLDSEEFVKQTGLKLTDADGKQADIDITQFLNRSLSLTKDMQEKVFKFFNAEIESVTRYLAETNQLDAGLETVTADRVQLEQEQVIFRDEEKNIETSLVELNLENRINYVSFKRAKTGAAGFYINRKSGKIRHAEKIRERTNPQTGSIEQYTVLTNPANNTVRVSVEDLSKKYEQVSAENAEFKWNEEIRNSPEFKKSKMYLFTGSLLPIWDRLNGKVSVARLETDSGERYLGAKVEKQQLDKTLEAMNIKTEVPDMDAGTVKDSVLAGGEIVFHDNTALKRSKVSGENRIELVTKGQSLLNPQVMEDYGLFSEQIQWKTRWFIPLDDNAENIISELMKDKDIIKVNSGARYSIDSVKPWPKDFPKVMVQTTRNYIKKNLQKDFEKAKSGDFKAARHLVEKVVKADRVQQIKTQYPNAEIIPVVGIERTGKNAIPITYAHYISEKTGFKINDSVILVNKPGHTGSDGITRLTGRAAFQGEIKSGQTYILIDDHVTMGGTLSELRHFIENKGGKVVFTTTLTASAYATNLRLTEETKNKLIKKFGRKNLEKLLQDFNIAGKIEALTEAEGRYIAKFNNVDSARAKFTESVGKGRLSTAGRNEQTGRQANGSLYRELKTHLSKLIKNINTNVHIVQKQSDLPKFLIPESGRVRGVYNPATQDIYLVAENLTKETAEQVLLHEAVGHHGLRKLMGHDFEKFLNQLWFSKAKEIKNFADSDFNPRNKEQKLLYTEEWFAKQVETGRLNPKFFDKFVRMFRQFLRKIGFNVKLSDAEIRDIAANSRKAAEKSVLVFEGEKAFKQAINNQPVFSMADSVMEQIDKLKEHTKDFTKQIGKQDTSWLDRNLSLLSHHAKKVPALKRMFDIALKKDEIKQDVERQLMYEYGKPLFNSLHALKKKRKSEYKRLKEYLVERDKNKVGYNVKYNRDSGTFHLTKPNSKVLEKEGFFTRDQAWEEAIVREAKDWISEGGSVEGGEALRSFRQISHNMHKQMTKELDEYLNFFESKNMYAPDKVTLDENNRKIIALKRALVEMGDLRGFYFPRMRNSGDYILVAKKDGTNPFMDFYDIKSHAVVKKKILEKKGYKVTIDKSSKLSEDVYEMAGGIIAQQALMQAALDRMDSSVNRKKTLRDLNLSVKTFKKKNGLYIAEITGQYDQKMVDVFKDYGGEYFEKEYVSRSGRGWTFGFRFHDVSETFESEIKDDLFASQGILPDLDTSFAEAVVESLSNTLKERGSRARMISRTSAVGKDVYVGYEEDPLEAIVRAASSIAGGEAKKQTITKMTKTMMGTDLTWAEFKDANPRAKYREYAAAVRDRQIDAAKQKNAFLEGKTLIEDMARNDEKIDRIIGTLKSIAVFKYLAFSVASPIVNLTNMVAGVPAAMNGYAKIPFKDIPKHIAKASKDYGKYKFPDKAGKPDAEMIKLYDDIEAKGWHKPQYNKEIMQSINSKLGNAWSKTLETGMSFFGITEQYNRVASIAGAYLGIKAEAEKAFKQGKNYTVNGQMFLSWDNEAHKQALELSKEVSDKAHGIYGKENRPLWARGSNPMAQAAQLFYVFKTFSHNYLLTAYDLGFKTKGGQKAALWMMFSPAIFGAGSALGVKAVISTIGALLGSDDPEEDFYKFVYDNMGAGSERFARYGVTGFMEHGISLKGSLDIGIFDVPVSIQDFAGAPGSVVTDIYDGFGYLIRGDQMKALEKFAPRAVAMPVKSAREYSEGVTTKNNSPVFFGNEQIKPDAIDAVIRALTFNPSRIARKREIQYSEYRLESKYRELRTDIYARFKKFYLTPVWERSKADYLPILNDIREYNAIAATRSNLPEITSGMLKSSLKRALRPDKKERLRERL